MSVLLAVVALAPALGPGYVLSYDMVAVPRLDLTRDVVGLGDGLPRAVPVDAVVALLTYVVPGWLVQKAALLAALVVAGAGAGRLAQRLLPDDAAALLVATAVYLWNPYVAERLVLGHWALLLGYAVLPWLAGAAADFRRGDRRALARLVALTGVAALTPTGGLLALLMLCCVLAGYWRRLAIALVAWVLVNAPWWLPGLLHVGLPGGDPAAGVKAFAVRSENLLGPLGAVASLGGTWNSGVVPGSRDTVLGVLATALVVVVTAAGTQVLRRSADPWLVGRLAVAAGVGLVLALLGAVPGVRDLLAELIDAVPAAGLLRDGQKWLAPWALLLSLLAGAASARAARVVRDAGVRALVPVAAVLVVVALLPDLVWGASGRLRPADYPPEWDRVRAAVAGGDGDVVVLPWGSFRAFGWNGRRTVLDPAPRYLPGSVVSSDDLAVGDLRVAGDGRRSAAAARALDQPDPGAALLALGVRFVLVHVGQPGTAPDPPAGRVVVDTPTLRLLRLAGPVAARQRPELLAPVVAVDLLALLAVIGAAALGSWRGDRARRGLPVGTVPPSSPKGADAAAPGSKTGDR
jgi:hypothetical protein